MAALVGLEDQLKDLVVEVRVPGPHVAVHYVKVNAEQYVHSKYNHE